MSVALTADDCDEL